MERVRYISCTHETGIGVIHPALERGYRNGQVDRPRDRVRLYFFTSVPWCLSIFRKTFIRVTPHESFIFGDGKASDRIVVSNAKDSDAEAHRI